jgi:hypothetical protein
MSVLFPAPMLGQPSTCGGLGIPKARSNQRRTKG